ncbi:hypothetical protein V5O48_017354 [Marasmius crinis-equi]|uniref:DUF6535 domain-containing protein n=1 Tax=Marasmius crinis-equi TaxID=585013 RepID=A0ABR3EP57_9AGAR
MARLSSSGDVEESFNAVDDDTSENASTQPSGEAQPTHDASPPDPRVADSWGKLMFQVMNYDEGVAQAGRGEVDALLAFSGLFSIMVAVFAIDSYKRLSENPTDITVTLLAQISRQLMNPNIIQPPPPPFRASPSSVRINCFWFLSLVMSLTSSIIALLCKQWSRAHRQDTPTPTPIDALALRQMRQDSYEKWGVPTFVAAIPVLLEIAILLFFAGLLEFLWTLRTIPLFVVGAIAIGLSAGLYATTTFLPAVMALTSGVREAIYDFRPVHIHVSYETVCPYKSPQAWGALGLLTYLISVPPFLRLGYYLTHLSSTRAWMHSAIFSDRARMRIRKHWDWSALDMGILRKWEDVPGAKHMYQFQGLRWMVAAFRDIPAMREWIKTVLCAFPPPVVVSAVFPEHLNAYMWVEPTTADIEYLLSPVVEPNAGNRLSKKFDWIGVEEREVPLGGLLDVDRQVLFNVEALCTAYEKFRDHPTSLEFAVKQSLKMARHLSERLVSGRSVAHFTLPFYLMCKIWTHPSQAIREAGLECLDVYEEEWEKTYNSEWGLSERYALVANLADHLASPSAEKTPSVLVTSNRGIAFIRFIHTTVAENRIGQDWTMGIGRIVDKWRLAIERVQQLRPGSTFEPIAHYWGYPGQVLNLSLNLPSWISYPAFPSFTPPAISSANSVVISFDGYENMGYADAHSPSRTRDSYTSGSRPSSGLGANHVGHGRTSRIVLPPYPTSTYRSSRSLPY